MIAFLLLLIAALLIGGIALVRVEIRAAATRLDDTLKGAEAAIVSLVELEDQKRQMRQSFASGYGRDLLRQRLAERLQAAQKAKAQAKKAKV